ncbi:histidine phosphatase family protein, partial [Patescibacteria group bacterium]|nr:histidine phosphatase family protein [Patescibacteria group bacterium]
IKKLDLGPKIIFSSNLKRAKDSSEIISKELGLKIKYDQLLQERKGGASEGKIEKEIDWQSYEKTSFPYRKHTGGESFIEVKKRAKEFLDNILKKEKQDFIIVSHSAFLSMLLSYSKNWSIKKSCQFNFNNSVTIIDTKNKRVEQVPLS